MKKIFLIFFLWAIFPAIFSGCGTPRFYATPFTGKIIVFPQRVVSIGGIQSRYTARIVGSDKKITVYSSERVKDYDTVDLKNQLVGPYKFWKKPLKK